MGDLPPSYTYWPGHLTADEEEARVFGSEELVGIELWPKLQSVLIISLGFWPGNGFLSTEGVYL